VSGNRAFRRLHSNAVVWAIALGVALAACDRSGGRAPEAHPRLRVGVLPDEAEARLRAHYDPLLAYVSAATGLDLDLYIPSDYGDLLDAFDAGAVDLAWFGGLTFSRAQQRSNALPLVSRDVDVRFTSSFVVRSDAEGSSIEAFAGKPLAFGPRLSTSGHLMPRAFLEARGIQPESFFGAVKYSAGHDETLAFVADGVAAIGAVNSVIAEAILGDGGHDLRIVAATPPYQNYVWATPETLDAGVRGALLDAFLELDPAVPEHAVLLSELGAGGFLPVGAEAYIPVRQAAREAGLLEDAR